MKTNIFSWILNIVLFLILLFPLIYSQQFENNIVPNDFSGSISVKEGTTLKIGGKDYSFGKTNKLAVEKGKITEFDGTLNNEAEIGGNQVKGYLSYSGGKYAVTDGSISQVQIKNAYDVTVSGSKISGWSNEGCVVAGNSIEKDSKFT